MYAVNHPTLTGEKLRKLRMEVGITQEELANATGYHKSWIGKIERGQVRITMDRGAALLEALAKADKSNSKNERKETKAKLDNKECKSCIYYSISTCSCDYILVNKRRRGCPSGKFCSAKVPGEPKGLKDYTGNWWV